MPENVNKAGGLREFNRKMELLEQLVENYI